MGNKPTENILEDTQLKNTGFICKKLTVFISFHLLNTFFFIQKNCLVSKMTDNSEKCLSQFPRDTLDTLKLFRVQQSEVCDLSLNMTKKTNISSL